MRELKFWKMHGIGNDYVVIDNTEEKLREEEISGFAKRVCRRRFSVGADGLLLVCNSDVGDIKMRIFNPNGTEAEMCGNGIRCVVRLCYEKGIAEKDRMKVETSSGIKRTWLQISGGQVESVKVDMGKPCFDRSSIPMLGKGPYIDEHLEINGETRVVTCLSVGNPHCVLFVNDVELFPVREMGPKIESNEVFPNHTNVEFVQILNPKEIKVRVWERGVGETLACGTGACASVVACYISGKTDRDVTVHLSGGDLEILYDGNIFMKGPVVKIYEGELS